MTTQPSKHTFPTSLPLCRKQSMSSPFSRATSLHDYRDLLEAGFDPNSASSEDGTTAIFHLWHREADVDYTAILNLFLEHGANLNHTDFGGNTALFRSESDSLSLSLVKAGASMITPRPNDFQTRSVVVSSARKGHVNSVKYMIETGAVSVDAYLGRGTALHHMLYSFLHLLEESGFVEGLESLVRYANDVDARDFLGKTPLYLVYDSEKCARVLLNAGADPECKIPRGWWFHRSAFDDLLSGEISTDCVDSTLMQGRSWETAIHGVETRSPEVLRLLLENGAGVNTVDSDGNTALLRLLSHRVLTHHLLMVFNILFSFGASCTIRNTYGEKAADMPLPKHYPGIAERVENREREENWFRRRPFFLVLVKCASASGDSGVVAEDTECGILKLLATGGHVASEGFMRVIVEFI